MAYTKLFNWAIDAIRQPKIIDARLDAEFGAVATASAASVSSLNGQTGALKLPFTPGGRVTPTTGVSIPTADVTGATSIYYTPAVHDYLMIYDGTNWVPTQFTELTLALDSNGGHSGYQQSGKNWDLFVFNDSGTIRLGSGPAWNAGAGAGSDTARGTGAGSTELQLLNGIWTNKNSLVARFGSASGNLFTIAANQGAYVGTFRTTADGVTEDSIVKRWLWNAYNQAVRYMYYTDPAASWNYSTAAARQANNSTANQLDFVVGLGGIDLSARAMQYVLNSTSTVRPVYLAFSLDATTLAANSPHGLYEQIRVDNVLSSAGKTFWDGYVGIGRHFLALVEIGAGADTQTWNHGALGGLAGEIWG